MFVLMLHTSIANIELNEVLKEEIKWEEGEKKLTGFQAIVHVNLLWLACLLSAEVMTQLPTHNKITAEIFIFNSKYLHSHVDV